MVNSMLELTGHENEVPNTTYGSFDFDYNFRRTGAIADSVWAAENLTLATVAINYWNE